MGVYEKKQIRSAQIAQRSIVIHVQHENEIQCTTAEARVPLALRISDYDRHQYDEFLSLDLTA